MAVFKYITFICCRNLHTWDVNLNNNNNIIFHVNWFISQFIFCFFCLPVPKSLTVS